MKKNLLVIVVVCFGFVTSVFAEPICKIATNGSQVAVTVSDTGVVWSDGQNPPQGWVSYPGTGRAGDIAASCSDNEAKCASASWYLRFADASQGWPSDGVLDSDPRVVKCVYSNGAISCHFTLTSKMETSNGKIRMHYVAKIIGDQVVAAYQPKSGCHVDKESVGGNPHTVIKTK